MKYNLELLAKVDAYLATAMRLKTEDLDIVTDVFKEIEHDWPNIFSEESTNTFLFYPKTLVHNVRFVFYNTERGVSGGYDTSSFIKERQPKYHGPDLIIVYCPTYSWDAIKSEVYSVLIHEHIHYLQAMLGKHTDKVINSLTRANDLIAVRAEAWKDICREIPKTVDDVKRIEKVKKIRRIELNNAYKRYYTHTLEKASHAGQIVLELMFTKVGSDNLFNRELIKDTCYKLATNNRLEELVKNSVIWGDIVRQFPPKLLEDYFKQLIKEGRRILLSIAES